MFCKIRLLIIHMNWSLIAILLVRVKGIFVVIYCGKSISHPKKIPCLMRFISVINVLKFMTIYICDIISTLFFHVRLFV